MNLTQLRYFAEAARCLNFSRAAELLYISQPALSRQISKLEESIGARLFERGNRGLELTPAGELLLQEADGIFLREQELLRRLRAASPKSQPPLKIAFTNDVFLRKLNLFARDYAHDHPAQKFLIDRYNWMALRHELARGIVDLVVSLRAGLDDIPGVRYRILHTGPNMVVLSKNHPLAGRSSLTLGDLREETFMLPESSFAFSFKELKELCAAYGFEPKTSMEHPILDSVLLDIAQGGGVATIMEGLMPAASALELVSIPCPDLPRLDFVVAWHRSVETNHLLSVVDAITDYPWFET